MAASSRASRGGSAWMSPVSTHRPRGSAARLYPTAGGVPQPLAGRDLPGRRPAVAGVANGIDAGVEDLAVRPEGEPLDPAAAVAARAGGTDREAWTPPCRPAGPRVLDVAAGPRDRQPPAVRRDGQGSDPLLARLLESAGEPASGDVELRRSARCASPTIRCRPSGVWAKAAPVGDSGSRRRSFARSGPVRFWAFGVTGAAWPKRRIAPSGSGGPSGTILGKAADPASGRRMRATERCERIMGQSPGTAGIVTRRAPRRRPRSWVVTRLRTPRSPACAGTGSRRGCSPSR